MLRDKGTAGFCPTFVTGNPDLVRRNLRICESARKNDPECGARILGYHLEGPFISREPGAVGTHPIQWVHAPDLNLFDSFMAASGNAIRLLTVAAELPGIRDFTRAVVKRGVTVSCGHQLAHTPDELAAFAQAGGAALTHLGNGVPNLLPRHDNILWAGLAEDRLAVMFIPDGRHLPDSVLKVFLRAVPLDRLIAVTDSCYPAGLPPGPYSVFGAEAILEPNGLLHNPERHCLVGSISTMEEVMARLAASPFALSREACLHIGQIQPLRLIHAEERRHALVD